MPCSRAVLTVVLTLTLAVTTACGSRENRRQVETPSADEIMDEILYDQRGRQRPKSTVFGGLLRPRADSGQIGAVNKYLWNASLEVLDFLPVQSVDPFTGVITTGFGTPPGGARAYRATIVISDPALEARSLNVALVTKGGAANASTVRAVEDAILTRGRLLRQQDSRL